MESRVNPLHLLPQLTMNSRGSKRFDFGLGSSKSGKGAGDDDDWMSVADDRKIDLSGS